jgi:DNA (cytosine-5)-methyltransferase 1
VRYLSVCSGIEAATVAWHDLGWTPVAFSEIEPFPSAVLKHHYPDVPNVGDMTKFKEWNLGPIDLLVGGTPCQSFSVAGLRKGLDDPRGNLMLTFLAIAERHRPQWIVWENVPGVLSSNGGRDFGTFLGALGELGYGWAYRVLDAQWFGVAQRRRRVFVVGCLGDQAGAAAVLFESESVQRNPAPSREKGQSVAGTIAARFGISRNNHEECVPTVAGSLDTECGGGKLTHQSVANGHVIAQPSWWDGADVAATLTRQNAAGSQRMPDKNNLGAVLQPVAFGGDIARSLTARYDSSPCADRGMDVVAVAQPVAFHPTQDPISSVDVCHALSGGSKQGTASAAVAQPVAFAQNTRDEVRLMNGDGSIVGALAAEPGMKQTCYVAQPVATFAKTHKPMSATDAEGWSPVDAAPTVTHWPRDRSDAGTDVAVVQPVGTDCYNGAITGEVAATMGTTGSGVNGCGPTVMQPVGSFKPGQSAAARSIGYEAEVAPALEGGGGGNNKPAVHVAMQVRRLTPTECERLQGFPDGYTNISWRKKDEAPDGPRYKALGNSMAVPCMKWIGERIAKVTK